MVHPVVTQVPAVSHPRLGPSKADPCPRPSQRAGWEHSELVLLASGTWHTALTATLNTNPTLGPVPPSRREGTGPVARQQSAKRARHDDRLGELVELAVQRHVDHDPLGKLPRNDNDVMLPEPPPGVFGLRG